MDVFARRFANAGVGARIDCYRADAPCAAKSEGASRNRETGDIPVDIPRISRIHFSSIRYGQRREKGRDASRGASPRGSVESVL